MDFALTATTVVPSPPEQVFSLITDIDRLPDWNAEIPKILERPAALTPGAQWVVEIRAMHTHWNSRSTVVELDAERGRFAYRSQSDDGNPSFAEWLWDVAPDPAGTRVAVTMQVHPKTFFRKAIASRMRRSSLDQAMRRSLDALAQQLAAAPAPEER